MERQVADLFKIKITLIKKLGASFSMTASIQSCVEMKNIQNHIAQSPIFSL